MNKKQPDNKKQQPESPDQNAAAQPEADNKGQAHDHGSQQHQQEHQQQVEQDLRETMDALRQERDQIENRLMRTAADYQNYVKRAEQNARTAQQQQLMDMAKGLVTVLDHFDRALEVDAAQTSTKDVLAGVQMVHDELLRMLQRFGIERLEVAAGEPFDPNRHEALMRENREDVESDHVTQQFQPGYVIEDKVIRPAKVGVAE